MFNVNSTEKFTCLMNVYTYVYDNNIKNKNNINNKYIILIKLKFELKIKFK